MTVKLLPTSVVGSYPQPDWLIDRSNLGTRLPPRVRAAEIWRVAPEFLEQAQDDATLLAIHDMEQVGLDIITDGEIRRESYSNRIATALGGIDIDNPGTAIDRTGHPNPVPRIAGPIHRARPIEVRDAEFLVANTDRMTKITVPRPAAAITVAITVEKVRRSAWSSSASRLNTGISAPDTAPPITSSCMNCGMRLAISSASTVPPAPKR